MSLEKNSADDLGAFHAEVRGLTARLVEPLSAEDMLLQSMTCASPVKWHLAHTTWFFETFVLAERRGYQPFDPQFPYLFNSYYNTLGERIARNQRNLLSRPTLERVWEYRSWVDGELRELLHSGNASAEERARILIGLHHEQQHQELILTDVKHGFWCNPLRPAYREGESERGGNPPRLKWLGHEGGLEEIGHSGAGFAYDNESPRHRVYLRPFEIASRLVSCGEYLEFVESGGYGDPQWWLSDGWDACRAGGWTAPLYWENHEGKWQHFTLEGMRRVEADAPVSHVSFYEADAFARWAGARLPTEAEWEVMAARCDSAGGFLDAGRLRPAAARGEAAQFLGEAWQWTASPYVAYPGYRPPDGALGEYNAKFMCNQFVLRGGSCFTPRSHFRVSYRNFFPPDARWQVTGFRLARDA